MTGTPPAAYNGRYELRSQVARGGTAQVYLARDLLLDRPVALKVLDPQLSTDHTFVERFRREAQAAANLSHPNIVPVFDWGEADHTYFIVMEYVDGEPLSAIIRSQAPLDAENSASIAIDIAKALSYAHRHGVVHRDVKPGNVLITSDGQVKVTDFGIARAIGADEQVTQTGLVMGTATYFSPEQAQGLGVDGRSDLYALGVVLYEMATGRPPFTGDTPVSIAYQHVREIPPTPRSLNANIPPALEAIILQAMAKVPGERYATADDLRADLERFLRHQPVLAKVPSEYTGSVVPLSQETALLSATTVSPATPRRPDRQKSTTPYWVAAAIVLLAALAATAVLGGRALGYFGAPHYLRVPDVEHLTLPVAESRLRAAGFVPHIAGRVPGTLANQNTVTVQSPTYPNTAKRNTTVNLTVAGAVPTAVVPTVTDEPFAKAKQALRKQGFRVTEKTVSPTNSSQANNLVIAQDKTGIQPKGSTITLSVVQTTTVAVPTLAGQTTTQAGVLLDQAKLTPGTTTQQYSSSVQQGSVISSSPAAGTQVAQGSAVNLVVSSGAGDTVPDVIGLSDSNAQAAIRNAGLLPVKGAPKGTTDSNLTGQVWYQRTNTNPPVAAGGQVAPNTEVFYRLYVLVGGSTTTTTSLPGNTGTSTTTTSTLPISGPG
ncbi:MAG TPA: Stk1 family PASTA domain-containing Ser/Thr kinase [Acidimicrobiales bacterium]|nr:Stk1 family PASTA domain-containing Ser/Thr kinase [Acidimicrobiales bacterium]